MEEAWKSAMSDKLGELTDQLTLDKVQVSRTGDSMIVFLHAGRIMTESEYDKIKNTFRAFFRGVNLTLKLSYPSFGSALCADVSQYRDFLTRQLGKASPGSIPALKNAAWTFQDGALTLGFQDEVSASYARHRGVDRLLSTILKDEFAVTCPVRVAASGDEKERLRQIAERQAEEEKRLAALTATAKPAAAKKAAPPKVLYGRSIADPEIEIRELTEDAGRVVLKGEVLKVETRPLKNDTTLLITFALTDYTGTVNMKTFARIKGDESHGAQQLEALKEALHPGAWVKARGKYQMDNFMHEMVVMVDDINREEAPRRVDTAVKKRVEMHMHTQMSAMDGVSSASDLIAQAAKWGHPAVAITDHGVLQAFPEAFGAAKKAARPISSTTRRRSSICRTIARSTAQPMSFWTLRRPA